MEIWPRYVFKTWTDGQPASGCAGLCWLVTSSALKSCGRSLGHNPGTQGFCAL